MENNLCEIKKIGCTKNMSWTNCTKTSFRFCSGRGFEKGWIEKNYLKRPVSNEHLEKIQSRM